MNAPNAPVQASGQTSVAAPLRLSLHNSLGGEVEVFEPADPQRVTMYVCGPTVYNFIHVGNARPVVVFDVLFRVLQALYGADAVVYARNITDVDDKINAQARTNGEDIGTLTARFTAAYHEDCAALSARRPSIEPRATDHIAPMIELISTLLERDAAYVAAGHVLFDVTAFPRYGALSNRTLDDMRSGARVEVADYKRHPGDFVLWKPAAADEPGWDSPWGRGRPGWHLECTAMIRTHLGEGIDIHGGGHDLIFPHHENEIAQGCAAGCDPERGYARYWVHNGHLTIDGEKMSKSLGNFRLLRDLRAHYSGEVLRFALLARHYRAPLNFSEASLDQARNTLDGLYRRLRDGGWQSPTDGSLDEQHDNPVVAALLDDLNTPGALAALHTLVDRWASASGTARATAARALAAAIDLLGVLASDPQTWFQSQAAEAVDGWSAEHIEAAIEARAEARRARDFARADALRDELSAAGIELEDGPDGTRWTRR